MINCVNNVIVNFDKRQNFRRVANVCERRKTWAKLSVSNNNAPNMESIVKSLKIEWRRKLLYRRCDPINIFPYSNECMHAAAACRIEWSGFVAVEMWLREMWLSRFCWLNICITMAMATNKFIWVLSLLSEVADTLSRYEKQSIIKQILFPRNFEKNVFRGRQSYRCVELAWGVKHRQSECHSILKF